MPDIDLDRKATRQFELRRRGIQQGAVAERAGVSESTVSKVFAGTYPDSTDEGRATVERVEACVAAMIEEHDLSRARATA